MKMLKNGLEADASATSRIPIQSPPSTKRGVVLRCAARPPARPAHDPHDPHVEDEAVAVAEPVDEVPALRKQKKRYKNRGLLSIVPKKCVVVVDTRWPLGAIANAPRLDDHHVDGGSRVEKRLLSWISKKGFKLLTDPAMWKIPSKADIRADKQRVANYKRQYRASGTKDSYNKWLVKKGYAKKVGGCSLM